MSEAQTQSEKSQEQTRPFTSKLSDGRERFLAHVVEHSLTCGRRSPEDFIRHFPPSAIMAGLRNRPALRAKILVATTGIKTRIAGKKSAESSGEDLQIALDEAETDPSTVVSLIDPDDRVRYLSDKALWQFVIEGEFWDAPSSDAGASKLATEHVAFMLDRALQDELLTHRDIIDGISIHRIAQLLPRIELEKIISAALTAGQEKQRFTEASLVDAVGSQTLLEHVPLKDIWNSTIVPKIAETHGFVEAAETPMDAESTSTDLSDKVKKFSPANANASQNKDSSSAAESQEVSDTGAAQAPKSTRPEGADDIELDFNDITEVKAGKTGTAK